MTAKICFYFQYQFTSAKSFYENVLKYSISYKFAQYNFVGQVFSLRDIYTLRNEHGNPFCSLDVIELGKLPKTFFIIAEGFAHML